MGFGGPAWPQLRYPPHDLARVCLVPAVETVEYHLLNQAYGFDRIIKRYADLPLHEPLPWAMEHFISFDHPTPLAEDAASPLPFLLAVSEGQRDVLRAQARSQVEAIGAAYFYVRRILERSIEPAPPVERRGTIVFPLKSSALLDRDFDRARFARDLAALPDELQPVVVSIGWKDFHRGAHEPFEACGLPVVSSGHSFDPLFLFRLYDLCRQFRYACSNEISTSFCYSVLSGCRFFFLPSGPVRVTHGDETRIEGEERNDSTAKRACQDASPFPPRGDGATQRALADRFAGAASVRPSSFFRALADEGRRRFHAMPRRSIVFAPGLVADHAATWLTHGIDSDGWARTTCGLSLPGGHGYAGVRLSFMVPPRPVLDWCSTWTIAVGDGESWPIRIQAGFWTLDLPCDAAGAARPVTISSETPIVLAGETRQRAFRLTALTCLDSVDALRSGVLCPEG